MRGEVIKGLMRDNEGRGRRNKTNKNDRDDKYYGMENKTESKTRTADHLHFLRSEEIPC